VVSGLCFVSSYSRPSPYRSPAPTGSGKTVLFELAIVALLSQPESAQSRIVYMAPTKVCSNSMPPLTLNIICSRPYVPRGTVTGSRNLIP